MTIDALEATGSREQGSLAWKVARLGRFTASVIFKLMIDSRAKDKMFGEGAISYMAGIAAERMLSNDILTDEEKFNEYSLLHFPDKSEFRHGHQYEGIARDMYEINYNASVQQCGLLLSKDTPGLAASPDGVICDSRGTIKGCIEIKCPAHVDNYMRYCWNIKDGATLKSENKQYYWQVQAVMAVTGARYCDFIIYCPYMKTGKDMKVVRIERNDKDIVELQDRVKEANKFIDDMDKGDGAKVEEDKAPEFCFPDDLGK